MEINEIIQIIKEELSDAESRIIKRLTNNETTNDSKQSLHKPIPDNANYAKALSGYLNGGTHSGMAKELGVSLAQVKKYYNWLVINGYLPTEDTELSETEKCVVDLIYIKKMSLRETAKSLGCSITNVTYRRDSALRKGYKPNESEVIM